MFDPLKSTLLVAVVGSDQMAPKRLGLYVYQAVQGRFLLDDFSPRGGGRFVGGGFGVLVFGGGLFFGGGVVTMPACLFGPFWLL